MEHAQATDITGQADKQTLTNEAQAQPSEAKPQEMPEFLSSKFAALARKEKQLRTEKLKMEQERQQRSTDLSDLERLRSLEKRLQTNPLDVVDYNQITESYLAQPNPELRPLLAKIQQLEEGQKTFLTQAEQREKQQYDAAVNQIRLDANRLISTDPNYEVIKELGTVDEVVKKITDHYDKTGDVKDIEEAVREVQEDFVKELTALYKLAPIQRLLNPPKQDPAPTEQVQEAPAQQQQAKPQQPQPTLSHRIVQSGAPKPLTAKEKRERAIRAFMGQPIS